MPYNVQLPNGMLVEGIPDDVPKEEARRRILEKFPDLAPKAGVTDYLKDVPKALGRGAVGLLETAGIGAAAILPEEYEQKARAGIESLAAPAKEYLAPATPEIGGSVSSQLASGLGSTLPFFLAGPAGLAGRLAATGLGVSAGAGEARVSAEQAGATPEERAKATAFGAPTGLLDILAPNIGPLKSMFTTALARGGVEGLTEAAQKVSQNLIAKGVYNPEQDVLAGSAEEGAYGAGVGALASLLIDMTVGRKSYGVGAKPGAAGAPPEAAPQMPMPEGLPALPAPEPTLALPAPAETPLLPAPAEPVPPSPMDVGRVPGLAGLPGANEAMMGALRERQAEEARAEQMRQDQEAAAEADRQRQEAEAQRAQMQAQEDELRGKIAETEATTFSPDPVQDRVTKDRLIGQYRAQLGSITTARRAAETVEPPKFEPITAPQEKPKGAQTFKFTPQEQEYIGTLKTSLADVNSQITEAKKQKTSLFTRLTGELASRPGAFSVKDIVSSNKNLSKLFNKKGQGRLLEDMIADGSLDDFLPQKNRAIINGQQNPAFDSQAALNHIAEKLGSGDYRSTVEAETLDALQRQKEDLQKELDYVTSLPDVNAELARRAAAPKKAVEPVSIADLEAQAQQQGVDTEALKERIALQNPGASLQQFQGLYNSALTAATSTSPSYTIDGFQYTPEEIEDAIAERLTDEEIDEYIAQAEAEQAAARPAPKQPAPGRPAEPAPQRTAEAGQPAPEVTEVEPGAAEVALPKGAKNPRLAEAVADNDWNRVTNELKNSKNPIVARLGELASGLVGVTTEINPAVFYRKPKNLLGGWSKQTNGIYIRKKEYAADEHVIAHETAHALTFFAINNPKPDQKATVNQLNNLHRFAKAEAKKMGFDWMYGLRKQDDLDEFVAEAYSNPDFQKFLAKVPYQNQTAWGAFTQAVAKLLGIKNSNALTEVIALTEELANPQTRTVTKAEPKVEKPAEPLAPAGKEKPPVLTAPPGMKMKKGRNEQVVLAARELAAGRITKQQYDKYVDYYMPVEPVLGDKLEAPIQDNLMREILTEKIKQKKKESFVNAPIADGVRVGLRMDIPALEWGRANGVNGSVVSIHRGTSPDTKTTGPNISYRSTGHLKNAVFAPRSEEKAFGIAQGLEGAAGEKTPQQTIEGNWVNTSPEETFKRVQSLLNDPNWKQISLDPLRHSFFYDRANRQPVLSADEMLQVGRFVLAKNPVYGKREDFLYVEGKPEAGWDEKRIDSLINTYGYSNGKTYGIAAEIDPREFVLATTPTKEAADLLSEEAGELDLGKIKKETQTPFLEFDAEKNVIIGHEGRHRMAALARAGVERVPVVLYAKDRYGSKKPDFYEPQKGLKLKGQSFQGGMGAPIFAYNLIPISNKYKNELSDSYGKGDILFVERTPEADAAMDIMDSMGRKVAEPDPGYIAKARQAWDNARDNPSLAKEQSLGSVRRLLDQVQTWAFSSDAALNNQIRREILESTRGQEEKIGILLNASLSQTAHSDAVAGLFLTKGNIQWNPELHKWEGVDDANNILNLSKQLDEIAAKHGLTKEEVELVAHTAFEARRTKGLVEANDRIEAQAEAMRAEAARIRASSPVGASELMDKANRLMQKQKVIHMTPEQIQSGMSLFNIFPGLTEVANTWNGIRQNGIKVMVDTGLYTVEEAENLLANADYVPFFREDQIEEGKGPKEFLRSLSVQADKRMKGSQKPVNDIFDNMVRWTQYAVNRGVRNRSAQALVDTAVDVNLADKVSGPKDGDNVVRVWRNGQEEYYNMADPMFVQAFRGLESVAIPTIKFFSKFADILRNSVVLFPLFSVSQVTQDSFAAMFSSGLKPQYALSIPMRAVKEFVQTLRGKSSIHEELKNVGEIGRAHV